MCRLLQGNACSVTRIYTRNLDSKYRTYAHFQYTVCPPFVPTTPYSSGESLAPGYGGLSYLLKSYFGGIAASATTLLALRLLLQHQNRNANNASATAAAIP